MSNQSTLPQPSTSEQQTEVTKARSGLVQILSAVLLIFFWLPWIGILGFKRSGFQLALDKDLAKEEPLFWAFWLVPLSALITLLAGGSRRIGNAAQLTGVIPWFILAWALVKGGSDVMRILEPGAYATLIAGLLLILSPYLRR